VEDREESRAAMSGSVGFSAAKKFLTRLSRKKKSGKFFRNQEKIVALKNRDAYYAFQ